MLRVLLVSPVGEVGGGEKVFLSLIQNLPKWQVQPILACLRPGPLAQLAREQGLKVYEFQPHRYRQLPLVWKGIQWLVRVIEETDAQVVHVNHAGHIYSSLAAQLARIPEVWHLHDYPFHWDWVDRLSMRLPTTCTIFTTEKVKSGYPHLHPYPHLVIPPTCIDANHLRSVASEVDIRAKYHLPPGSLLLTVARLQEHKGHRYLIDAVPTVLKSHPYAFFVIVGQSKDKEQEDYRRSLLAQSQRLGVEEQVKFLGYVDEEDLISLYREASALVHPAVSEGFGLVLLEAMILGTPVIAASADGPRELIVNGQTGLLVPTSDSESLAKAIVQLLNTPDLSKALSAKGMSLAEQFSIEKMVETTVSMYRNLVPCNSDT